jgi:hypothetical protein
MVLRGPSLVLQHDCGVVVGNGGHVYSVRRICRDVSQ